MVCEMEAKEEGSWMDEVVLLFLSAVCYGGPRWIWRHPQCLELIGMFWYGTRRLPVPFSL